MPSTKEEKHVNCVYISTFRHTQLTQHDQALQILLVGCSESVPYSNVPYSFCEKKQFLPIQLPCDYRSEVIYPTKSQTVGKHLELVGGFNPSEKYYIVSWDDYSEYIYIYGNIQFMFQTTNQRNSITRGLITNFQPSSIANCSITRGYIPLSGL